MHLELVALLRRERETLAGLEVGPFPNWEPEDGQDGHNWADEERTRNGSERMTNRIEFDRKQLNPPGNNKIRVEQSRLEAFFNQIAAALQVALRVREKTTDCFPLISSPSNDWRIPFID